jgi:subtilisin-like proprotein convertase family protein
MTGMTSANGGIPLWEYIETDDFYGKNSYSADLEEVNQVFIQNQWRVGPITATTVAGGFQKWTEPDALSLPRPTYPTFGNDHDHNVAAQLYPNPHYSLVDCKLYTDPAATHVADTSGTGFYVTGYCTSGPGAADFSVKPSPASQAVIAGASARLTYTISTALLGGVAQNIALSVARLPPGITGSFDPASVSTGSNSTLTLTVAPNAAVGTTLFKIIGTGTLTTHTATASVTVSPNQPPTITIASPTDGSVVSGNVTIAAAASDPDGTIASVQFDFPDGTSTIDTSAPFSAMWNSATVADGSGYLIHATATDDLGMLSVSTVAITVNNCINNTFNVTGLQLQIPPNDPAGVTSANAVTGNGTVSSLSLSLNITHTSGDNLKVTLISPLGLNGPTFPIISGLLPSNINISKQTVTVPSNLTAVGTWQLQIVSATLGEVGTLTSWSMAIVGSCPQTTHWSGTATPSLPTVDNGMACTSLAVATAGDSSLAQLDIFGRHDFRSSLRGTLTHSNVLVEAFPVNTFPGGIGTFNFTNHAVPGALGDSSGNWTLCIVDTDGFGDTGVLSAWSVHD